MWWERGRAPAISSNDSPYGAWGKKRYGEDDYQSLVADILHSLVITTDKEWKMRRLRARTLRDAPCTLHHLVDYESYPLTR